MELEYQTGEFMWLARAFEGDWATNFWSSSAVVATAMLNLIEGGKGSGATGPPRKIELKSVLQSLPEAVVLFDVDSVIITVNKAAEQLTAQGYDALLSMDAAALSRRVSGADSNIELQTIVTRALSGECVRHQRGIVRSGQESNPIEVRISGTPLYYPSQRILGALVVIEDVTELSDLRQQVASGQRHFAVGQMTAGLAHDFNNVLGTISQAVYVLETEGGHSEPHRDMLGIIKTAVHRGAEIVNNMRDYLRGNEDTPTRTDMNVLLEEVLQLAQPMLKTNANIKVVREVERPCEVYASSAELRRVFTNLVLNALDAMPHGGTLTLRCSQGEGGIIVSVKDTGAGIPLETQHKIFSPYFTTKTKGTGLGLSGARRAIEAQGGLIRFESSPGAGTTFFVSLPIVAGQPREDPQAA